MSHKPNDSELSVLIVDDSRIVLNFATRVLKDVEINVSFAIDGREGYEMIRQNPPDLLITDIMMPEMDGFELISRIREDERFDRIHIIVMTALDQVEDKVRALNLGANDYTVKPLDAMELKARVRAGLREIQLKNKLGDALSALDQEMVRVANLQKRLLPIKLPDGDRVSASACYIPWSRAGGDYYDFFEAPDGRKVFTVADVSGHGASAALLMAMVRALLRVFVGTSSSVSEIVQRLNASLMDHIGNDPDFVTLFLALYEPDSGRLEYCSAGHGDMLLVGPEAGEIKRLESGGTVLGCFSSDWTESGVEVVSGQSLIMFTDGLIEVVNASGEEYGMERLEKLLLESGPVREPEEWVNLIRRGALRFASDDDFADDLTIFVIGFR